MDRTALAESLLRDAVLRSRLQRAAPLGPAESFGAIGQCGLGDRPTSAPESDDRTRVLLAQLWPDGIGDDLARRIREVCDGWVIEQDDLDRKRNHFLKDFRKRHGFARNSYSTDELAAYEDSLARINAEEDRGRLRAAQLLLDAPTTSSPKANDRLA